MYYKIKFNYEEVQIFNTIDSDNKKKKLMSVYSYLIKHSTDNKLVISASKLYKKYKRYHMTMSLAYFKKIINYLEDIGLILIDKSQKTNSYNLRIAQKNNPKVAEKVADSNSPESIDIPNVTYNFEKHNTKPFTNNYTNTLNTQEIVSPVELVVNAKKLMKELRVRSNFVKENVIKKLVNCNNINRQGMYNYILKVIIEKKIKQETRREVFKRKVKVGVSSQGSFNNYEQRRYTPEDFIDLEYKLLGLI